MVMPVKHGDSLTQHRDLQLVLVLEEIHELLQRHLGPVSLATVDLESVPEGPLGLVILLFLGQQRLRERKEWERKVGKSVLVFLRVGVTLHKLVQLEADEAGHEAGGGSDGGDDAARDALGLEPVRGGDGVVGGAQVGARHDEVDVAIGVVVLLELQWCYSDPVGFQCGGLWQFFENVVDDGGIGDAGV